MFKTHLLGKPVIRVTGAENIRKILLGEHSLVCTQWPQSTRIILGPNTLVNSIGDLHKRKRKVRHVYLLHLLTFTCILSSPTPPVLLFLYWKVLTVVYKVITFYDSSLFVSLNPFKILAKVFSRGALESYLPRLQDVVKSEIAKWCSEPGAVDVYSAARSLTFRIAVRVLLGLQLEEDRIVYLAQIFEQLMNNLFSLPIDAPLSGLRKVRQQSLELYLCNERSLCNNDES